jgi:hypothetical protein
MFTQSFKNKIRTCTDTNTKWGLVWIPTSNIKVSTFDNFFISYNLNKEEDDINTLNIISKKTQYRNHILHFKLCLKCVSLHDPFWRQVQMRN